MDVVVLGKNAFIRFGFPIVAGCIGFMLGALAFRRASETPMVNSSHDLSALRLRVSSLENELSEARRAKPVLIPPSVSTDAVPAEVQQTDSLALLTRLQTEKMGTVRLHLIDREGKLTPHFAKLFGLDGADVGQLQAAIDRAHAQIEEMTMSHAKLTRADGASVVISVPPFDGGAEVAEKVEQTFERVLGPERYVAFNSLGGDQLASTFSNFGAEQRTVQVTRLGGDAEGNPVFVLNDERLGPVGMGSRRSGMRFSDPAMLPERYRWLLPYSPQVAGLKPTTQSP